MPAECALDMELVHRVFRNEVRNAAGLVRSVPAGDIKRARVVREHLDFIVAALHHHHMAEDELVWPKLQARAPARSADITRMEAQHEGIAQSVAGVQSLLAQWASSADPQSTERLAVAVEDLSARVDEHLADEERNAVPLMAQHISAGEWREATDRGAEFLSARNLRLGLVLAGYVLDAASADERRRFLPNVPMSKRIPAQLFGPSVLKRYRKRLSGGAHTPSSA